MTGTDSIAGVVLAGGYSTRFGEADKAVTELAGTPMIRHVVDRLTTITDDIVVNCRDDQLDPIEAALTGSEATIRFATDPVPDRGPLAGIQVGLTAADREYAAVVACDMPFVDPDLLASLAERARGHDGAVVQLDEGWYQTTQAVYRADAMAGACEDALDSADNRVVAALDRIDVVTVPEAELEAIDTATFDSIDTQAALADAEARFDTELGH